MLLGLSPGSVTKYFGSFEFEAQEKGEVRVGVWFTEFLVLMDKELLWAVKSSPQVKIEFGSGKDGPLERSLEIKGGGCWRGK